MKVRFSTVIRSLVGLQILLMATGCATKLRTPLNRMISPESVGGAMNPEFELSSQVQQEGKVDINASEPFPLKFSDQRAMGYYGALSLAESVDVFWNHTASAPSIVGLKWQFIGGSLRQAGAGNSMAITAGFGGNEHEIDDSPKVEFESSGTDFSLIHGYWFTPNLQVFETLALSKYTFEGKVAGRGDFKDEGTMMTAAGGAAFVLRPYRLKVEVAYTQADWSESGKENYLSWAFGLGAFF